DYSNGALGVIHATRWAAAVKLDISGLAHVQAFQSRMMERPGVLAALRAQGLLK
ncbi:MAG: glutathione S-transferase family protein, partial [Pseudomonadota bacterium]